MSRRGRALLERAPWLPPLIAFLGAAALLAALIGIGSALAPRPQPVATATPAPDLDEVAVAEYDGPAPINYSFYDYRNIDFGRQYPDAGPVGSLAVFAWKDVHLGDNVFDWGKIDDYLAAAQGMTVTLDNGAVISKPVIIEITDSESAIPSREMNAPFPPLSAYSAYFLFSDFTPMWVRDKIRAPISPITWFVTLTPTREIARISDDRGSYMAVTRPGDGNCTSTGVAQLPKYDHPTWQKFYKQMIYALGARYNDDPRVAAVVFGPGIDGEYGQATKPYFECDLKSSLYRTLLLENTYLALGVKAGPLNDVSDWYRDAFPTKPIYLQFTSSGKGMIDTLHADGHTPPIGLKQATLIHDNNNQWQSDGNGTLQIMMRYSTTHPIAWENAHAYTGQPPRGMQERYFTLLGGLMSFPDFMDFIGGWAIEEATVDTGMFDFERRYLGRSITTTDEVWIALRETDHPTPSGGAIKYGGWRGDFTYGLARPEGIADNATRLVTTADLTRPPFSFSYPITSHIYSMIARRTDIASGNPYMSFAVDRRWPFWGLSPRSSMPGGAWYDITLKYIDSGTDALAIEYMDGGGLLRSKSIRKRGTGQWVTTTVVLEDAYLHGELPGGADLRLSAEPDRGGLDEIVHMVMIRGHSSSTPTPTPTVLRLTPTPAPAFEARINAGGDNYTDKKRQVWQADQPYVAGKTAWGYVGGNTHSTTAIIVGTDDALLYKSERWWGERGGYVFDVPSGMYEVELLFAETLRNGPNLRLFGVEIEGSAVMTNVDLYTLAGFSKPYLRRFVANVADGQLNIDFATRKDSAKINALRVTAVAPPAPTPMPTATPQAQSTPTATPTIPFGGTPWPTATATPPLEATLGELEQRSRGLFADVQSLWELIWQISANR